MRLSGIIKANNSLTRLDSTVLAVAISFLLTFGRAFCLLRWPCYSSDPIALPQTREAQESALSNFHGWCGGLLGGCGGQINGVTTPVLRLSRKTDLALHQGCNARQRASLSWSTNTPGHRVTESLCRVAREGILSEVWHATPPALDVAARSYAMLPMGQPPRRLAVYRDNGSVGPVTNAHLAATGRLAGPWAPGGTCKFGMAARH
jgi:hypothetical protein